MMTLLWLISASLISAAAGWMLYSYFASRGQFENLEEIKYQLFHDDERHPPRR